MYEVIILIGVSGDETRLAEINLMNLKYHNYGNYLFWVNEGR